MADSFTINIEADVTLSVDEIWPDGDAPENPTAQDVREAMEAFGNKYETLRDWDLIDSASLRVTVFGGGRLAEVWAK